MGFTPDGRALIATERGGDKLSAFAVGMDGMLGEPRTIDSLGATPYGFAISSNGTLVVTEAFRAEKGAAAASSYRVDGDTITPGTASVGNGRSEICWAVISNDGRYAFTTNFADGAVSRYAIGMEGGLTLEDATAGITEDGRSGLRDEDLSDDGRFLYAIDADQGQIVAWSVDEAGRSRWSVPGTACRRRSRVWRRADAARALLPGDVHHARGVERHPGGRPVPRDRAS